MTKQLINKSLGILWLMRLPIVSVSVLQLLISLNVTSTYNFYCIVSLAFVIMAGYVQNDILDYKIDKISAPSRPLPSGIVSVREAQKLYGLLVTCGGILGILSRNIFWLLYLCAILVIFYIYTKYCKSNWALKNLFTAFTSTTVIFSPIICGGKINIKIILLGCVAFFFTLGREILMDIRDRKGDQVIINVKRPAIIFGYIMSFIFLSISFIIKELFFFQVNGLRYITYLVFFLLVYLFFKSKSKYWIISESLKVIFIYDLIMIYVGMR